MTVIGDEPAEGTTLFAGATLVDGRGVRPGSWALVDGDSIVETGAGRGRPPADTVVDVGGAMVTPGLIDLHGHGGGGFSFDDGPAAISAALATHRAHGTTRNVISLVANPAADLVASLAVIADLVSGDETVLGAHLEGPFLSPSNRGAHHPDFLVAPVAPLIDELVHASRGTLRQVTIAPELPGALDAIAAFVAAGVRVALGHTVADYGTARAGFDRGATLLTHAYNAMPGLHHRAPGPVAAAFDDPRVTLELILDGVHVHPSLARVLFANAPGRVALITDAMAAAGAPDGAYRLGSLDVAVVDGVARLAGGGARGAAGAAGEGTIAGSTLTLDRALRLAVSDVGLSPADAVAALTGVPAAALGLDDRLGYLEPGYAADLVVWSRDWRVERVWAAGLAIPIPAHVA